MSEKLFRKTSLERVNSPEQLNEYIRVARPGVWVTLAAVILLLLGVVIWGVFGSVETSVPALAVVREGEATLYIPAAAAARVAAGLPVRVGEHTGRLRALSDAPARAGTLSDEATLASGHIAPDDLCYTARLEAAGLSDGVYAADIVVESLHPIRFVIQ